MKRMRLLAILIVVSFLLIPAPEALPVEAKSIVQVDPETHFREAFAATEPATIKIANLSCQELSALGSAVKKVLDEERKLGNIRKIAVVRAQQLAGEAEDVGELFRGLAGFFRKFLAGMGWIEVEPPENVVTLSIDSKATISAIGAVAGQWLQSLGLTGKIGAAIVTVLIPGAEWLGKEKAISDALGDIGYFRVTKPGVGTMDVIYAKQAKEACVNIHLEDLREEWKEEYGWENEHIYMYLPFDKEPPKLKKAEGKFDYKVIFKSEAVKPTLEWPLEGILEDRIVILGFGENWVHGYCDGLVKIHVGIDIATTKGEDVYAAEAGEVKWRGSTAAHPEWAYGIVIEHLGFTTVYWHIHPLVAVGDTVAKGEKIGMVADLGVNTHLHFGVRLASYSDVSIRGALPQRECGGDLAFPEYFVDPRSLTYIGAPPPEPVPPAGKIAFVSDRDGNQEIYVMNADGSNQNRLTYNNAYDLAPAWSPDGKKIAFTRTLIWEIYVINADGTKEVNLTNNPTHDEAPNWSPDGTKIAFTSEWEIYVMDANGRNQTRLTYNNAGDTDPAWSPDGTKIAFMSSRDGKWEIYIMSADGSNQTRLTYNDAMEGKLAWSPEGKKIAFNSDRDGNKEIYVMNADGSNQNRLTYNDAPDLWPAWSPDGTKIAFMSHRDGNQEIYVMNADGSNQTRLTYNDAGDAQPAWSPFPTKTPTPTPPPAPVPAPEPAVPIDSWQVDDDLQDYPDADFSRISDALSAASAGDTIIVYPGTYTENLDVSKDQLTIKSEGGADLTIVQAMDPGDHVFEIKADDIEIQGLTIRGATGDDKAGIYSYDSPLSVSDLTLSDNNYGIYTYSTPQSLLRVSSSVFSSNNRGIYSQSSFGSRYGEVHVSDSTFSDNNYGIYTSDFCGVNISNSAFSNNDYGIYGYNRMSIHVEYSVFSNNTYGIYGNSIWGINSSHSDFYDNDYGVYAVSGWDNTFSISYSSFRNNRRGIYYKASTLSSHTVFLNNFIGNTSDVDSSPSEYIWNSAEQMTYTYNGKTYTSYLGNYWSDYAGSDTNGDGIGDIPHRINSETDDYPLMKSLESYMAMEN